MISFLSRLISDDNGNLSSSRSPAVYLCLFGAIQLAVYAALNKTPLISGGEVVTLSSIALAAVASKKLFENGYGSNRHKPKQNNNSCKKGWSDDYNFNK